MSRPRRAQLPPWMGVVALSTKESCHQAEDAQ